MSRDADWQAVARAEMRFFGAVSAAISHEINNRFAVINEKAGLLQDLSVMMTRGKEVDPARLEVQSTKIIEQVRQAKEIVRNFNRFAHSVDMETAEVELGELLGFVAALYARKAASAEVTLSVSAPSEPVRLTTDPFVLQALIGRAIDIALSKAAGDRAVNLAVETAEGSINVRLEGLGGVTEPIDFSAAGEDLSALLASLGARFAAAPDGASLVLELAENERLSRGRTA